MPLQRRIPKRGFKNRNRVEYQVVNVGDLRVVDGDATPESLREAGLIRSLRRPVKILGTGEVEAAVSCSVHGVSAAARRKIEAAGGFGDRPSPARRGRRIVRLNGGAREDG